MLYKYGNLLQQEGYGNMQPSLDLITEQYNFDLSKTAYCEDKEVQLPSLEEVQQAMEKYSQKLPNLVVVNENGRRVLVAKKGCVIQSVTDGSILGKKLILGKKDSEIHYHEIPVPIKTEEDTEE